MRCLLLVIVLSACATTPESGNTARELRTAEDTPQAFVTEDGVAPEQGCRTTIIDPRDQTRLRLMRSAVIGGTHRGDYEVLGGKYGVTRDELLRIDCATGEPLGIVRN